MPMVDLLNLEDLSGLSPLWRIHVGEYSYVFYSGNRVDVYKSEALSPSYTITDGLCSCPAAQYGNSKCKHKSTIEYIPEGRMASTSKQQNRTHDTADTNVQNINDLL